MLCGRDRPEGARGVNAPGSELWDAALLPQVQGHSRKRLQWKLVLGVTRHAPKGHPPLPGEVSCAS